MTLQKSACIECMYQELPFLERFQAAAADGFPFVEFWSWEDKDLSAVQEAAERAGVGIAAFNGDASYSPVESLKFGVRTVKALVSLELVEQVILKKEC